MENKTRMIELLIESPRGHDTQLVPSNNIAAKVNEQIGEKVQSVTAQSKVKGG